MRSLHLGVLVCDHGINSIFQTPYTPRVQVPNFRCVRIEHGSIHIDPGLAINTDADVSAELCRVIADKRTGINAPEPYPNHIIGNPNLSHSVLDSSVDRGLVSVGEFGNYSRELVARTGRHRHCPRNFTSILYF